MEKFVNVLLIVFALVVSVAMIGALVFAIVRTIKEYNAPIEFAVVEKKYVCDGVPMARLLCDATLDGEVISFTKKVSLTAEQYVVISCGDVITFDENNQPIFEKGE